MSQNWPPGQSVPNQPVPLSCSLTRLKSVPATFSQALSVLTAKTVRAVPAGQVQHVPPSIKSKTCPVAQRPLCCLPTNRASLQAQGALPSWPQRVSQPPAKPGAAKATPIHKATLRAQIRISTSRPLGPDHQEPLADSPAPRRRVIPELTMERVYWKGSGRAREARGLVHSPPQPGDGRAPSRDAA